ncbi:MAG: tRNA pseudouridine(38-40) synthase TruA [Clostridia bacterium]|nr:tRNA pseudouridine(38-40) synthase TruA [Clostridia bacterium]
MRIALTVEYCGTQFAGWQHQPAKRTVQDELERALSEAAHEPIRVYASGRTDAGVHALGQVVHFDTQSTVPVAKWPEVVNNLLPPDVSVVDARAVDEDFHARKDAVDKTYVYRIFVAPQPRATLWDRAWVTKYALDVDAMNRAAVHLVGKHDFAAFRATGSSAKTTVRTVKELCVTADADAVTEGGKVVTGGITLRITADGFLYNMVRVITAQLALAGQYRRSEQEIAEILASGDRARAKELAPPQGLYLAHVTY